MSQAPESSVRARQSAAHVWLAATVLAGIVLLGLAAEFVAPPDPDNAFLLYAAGRVLDGAKLYVDIIEINPPLIVALNFPPILLARLLGVPDLLVFRVGVAALLGLSILVCQVGVRAIIPEPASHLRSYLTVLIGFVLFLLPGEVFSEREHLMLALVLPYLFLAIARRMDRPVCSWHAHGIGVLAGVGFALKPQFVVLWIALEAWLALGRKARFELHPEGRWVAALQVGYALAVLGLTPEYVAVVRRLGGAYLSFLRNPPIMTLLFGDGARLPLVALLAAVALRRRCTYSVAVTGLGVAIVGSLLVGIIQGKGWSYHFYPAFGVSLLLLGLLVATVTRPLPWLAPRIYGVVSYGLLVAVLLGSITMGAWKVIHPKGPAVEPYPGFWDLAALVRARAAGQPVMVLSYNMRSAWPLIPYARAEYPLRYPHLWMLWVLYHDQFERAEPLAYRPAGTEPPLEHELKNAVVADFERSLPRLLIALSSARDLPGNDARRLDYLEYFGRDPRFARQLSFYTYVATLGQHDVYERLPETIPGGPPRPPRQAERDLQGATRPGLRFAFGGPAERVRLVIFVLAVAVLLSTGWHRTQSRER